LATSQQTQEINFHQTQAVICIPSKQSSA